ncbi:MAG: biotin-dependent carboxyltransferase family protein [Ilumatobacteraceae bacterium]
MAWLVVVDAGWATSIQDAGRPGRADIGVPRSGAVDAPTRAVLNRLVGNPDDAAVLETLGGLRLTLTTGGVVASAAEHAARAVGADEEISVDPRPGHLWAYLAVRGGIAVEPVLGSRSRDSVSGLGPPAVLAGARLPIGRDPGTPILVDQAPPPTSDGTVRIWPGPRLDWFADGAFDQLCATAWTVSSDVSRVGARLDGPPLARPITAELPSEGLLIGAIQVPSDGRPVVMLADHPTTGGYPVVAVVDGRDLATIGQSRPGAQVRFRLVDGLRTGRPGSFQRLLDG